MSVELSAHSDFRGSDVRFGYDGGACIGGDQGREKTNPNHLYDIEIICISLISK
jgi:hypothetical protein